jgi:hypothetical protein
MRNASGPRAHLRYRIPFKEFNGIADRQDGFRSIVGNLETELPFKFKRQFNHVQAVSAKVVD